MKTKLVEVVLRKGRYLRFTATIVKSKKRGIPRTVQRSWKIRCDHAKKEDAEVSFRANASRWHAKKMAEFFPPPPTAQPLAQTEIPQ